MVGEIAVERPELNLVAGPTPERQQSGAGVDWRHTVEDLSPLRINRLALRDGTVHFRAFHADPPVDVYLQRVDLVVENLTNSRNLSDHRVARLALRGVPMSAGKLRARAALDPFAQRPDFDFDGQSRAAT